MKVAGRMIRGLKVAIRKQFVEFRRERMKSTPCYARRVTLRTPGAEVSHAAAIAVMAGWTYEGDGAYLVVKPESAGFYPARRGRNRFIAPSITGTHSTIRITGTP